MFDETPDALSSHPVQIFRIPAGPPKYVVIQMRSYVGCFTHWTQCHTQLCTAKPSCPSCRQNRSRRWQGFVFVRSVVGSTVRCLQFTAAVRKVIEENRLQETGVLGMKLKLKRRGNRINSPLDAECMEFQMPAEEMDSGKTQGFVLRLFANDGPTASSLSQAELAEFSTERAQPAKSH